MCIPAGKDWVDVFSALATPALALLGFAIAFTQSGRDRYRLRLELFDKRYGQFDAARSFIASIAGTGALDMEERRKFLAATAGSVFLFDNDLVAYLKLLHTKAIELRHTQRRLEAHNLQDEEHNRLNEKDSELVGWFAEQFTELELRFRPYLHIAAR
jgi:hypothetical protein